MADKRCEMCGKAYAKQYQELRKGMNKNDNGTDARDCKNNGCQNF